MSDYSHICPICGQSQYEVRWMVDGKQAGRAVIVHLDMVRRGNGLDRNYKNNWFEARVDGRWVPVSDLPLTLFERVIP